MKMTFVVLCLFCLAGAAFGQAAVTGTGLSSEPVVYEFQSHAAHAAPQTMGNEQNLLIGSGNAQAHGVRPLWEVHTLAPVVPLGDTARLLRKEHADAKKAEIVWNN
ncbi:MAG TPA: hypothetical protein VGZ28_09560 [Terriglobales bacterium]|jgi:hypothetical protein|nr:hypothetical protein [Terriglobales bacterium]